MKRRDFLKGLALPAVLFIPKEVNATSIVRDKMRVVPTVRGVTTFKCGATCKVHAFGYYVDPFETEAAIQSKLAQIEHSAYMQYLSYKPEGENIMTPEWKASRRPIMVLRREWDRVVDKHGEKRLARFWFAHVQSVQIDERDKAPIYWFSSKGDLMSGSVPMRYRWSEPGDITKWETKGRTIVE